MKRAVSESPREKTQIEIKIAYQASGYTKRLLWGEELDVCEPCFCVVCGSLSWAWWDLNLVSQTMMRLFPNKRLL